MKNLTLLFSLMMLSCITYSQAVAWELSAEPGNQASSAATTQGANFNNCVLSRGSGVTATAGAGSMNSSGWFSSSSPTSLADAIAGNDYYEFTVNTINCIFFNPTTIHIVLRSSATGPNTATLRCSSDGFTTDIGTVTVTTSSVDYTFSETVSPNSSSVTYRLYGYGTAAGGGTPGSGGTMRIGTSVVAADDDLQVFATSTTITVNPVSNINVNSGDFVNSVVFAANVPGAIFNWSRTPEPIGLNSTNGTGNVPAFTAASVGSPITSTFTVTATVGGCTSVDQTFTITVSPAPCTITVTFSGNPSSCNDNGTPNDPSDDFFTQNVQATFFNRPLTGNLQIVPGGDQIGTYSIPVSQIVGNSHIFTAVQFKADGTPTVIQMNFTDEPTCIDDATGSTVQPCSTPPPACTITVTFSGNPSSCNDNGTPNDPSDDFFTQNVQATFFNRPLTGNLQIVPGGDQIGTYSIPVQQIVGNSHIFTGVQFKADGTPTVIQMNFTDEPTCIDDATGSSVQPCSSSGSCDITSVNFINITSCDNNDTNDPTDDFYTADVVINFVNPPPTGNLQIEPGGDALGVNSIPVANLIGNTHTFIGVHLKADGTQTVIETEFTIPANVCVQTTAGPTVSSCSPICDITSIDLINIQSCDNNGTVDPLDDYYIMDVVVNYINPPQSGNLQIEPGGDAIGSYSIPVANLLGNSYTFEDVHFKADGNLTVIEVEFTIPANVCVQTIAGPTVDPCSYMPPVITCPVNVTVSCTSNVPPPNPASVMETHSCPGNVTKTFVNDVITNQTCTDRYAITRTYMVADECDNTATCSQIINVFDNAPPSIICPVNVTVQCANQVAPPSIASVTAPDNCGGTTTVLHVSDVTVNQICVNRYTINRTYRATDVCGNSATCIQTITVFDNTPPTISCPVPVTVQCANQVPAPNPGSLTTNDNCTGGAPVVSFVSDVTTNQTCFNRYTLTRTYRSTDACGNSATCTQIITVFDNTPPTITCLAPVTVQCANLVPAPAPGSLTTNDNCSGPAPVVTFVSDVTTNQTCVNRYTLTRTYRSTDACGNSATCTQVITVFDNTPPVITFSDPLIQGIPNGGRVDVQCFAQDPDWDLPDLNESSVTVTDNCTGTGTVNFSQVLQDAGDCPMEGYINLYRLTWVATDNCGNSSSKFVLLALVDTIPPVIEGVPADITVNCDEIPSPPTNITVTDECIQASIIDFDETSPAPGCQDGQVITRSWTARDECGNETIEVQHIQLVDHKGPSLQLLQPELAGLQDETVLYYTCNEGGIPGFFDDLNAESVYSAPSCGTSGNISFKTDFDIANNCKLFGYLQQKTVHWHAVDQCGNETNLRIYARLIDTEAPILVGVPDTACINDPVLKAVDAIDNCEKTAIHFWDVRIPNPCGNGNLFRRTYEVFDECGNMSRDTAILIPNDGQPPVMEFTNPILANLEPGEKLEVNCSGQLGDYTHFGPGDVGTISSCDFGVQIAFAERVIENRECMNGVVAEVLLEWTATDQCGNASKLTIPATVVDHEAPVFLNFVPEMSIGCNDSLPIITAFDNCGSVIIQPAVNVIQGPCPYEYDLVRHFSATDPCGNTASATQTIHVGNSSGPIISGVVPEICDDLSIPEVTAYDPCAETALEVVLTENELQTSCREGRVIERIWTASDACNHISEVRQIIIVNDHTPPKIEIPTYSIILRYLDQPNNEVFLSQTNLIEQLDELSGYSVFIEDECDEIVEPVFTVSIDHPANCEAAGYWERRTYSWTAIDICGNVSSISFSIDIHDDLPPVFVDIPENITVICEPLPQAGVVHVEDHAQPVYISYTETILPGVNPGEFLVTRKWEATDDCGNVATANQHIFWIPNTLLSCSLDVPSLVACNSHQVEISSVVTGGLGNLTYNWEIFGDQCFIQDGQGTNTLYIYVGWSEVEIVLTVYDAYGCSSTCSAIVDCFDTSIGFNGGSNINGEADQSITRKETKLLPSSKDSDNASQIELWPNPADESITVVLESKTEEPVEMRIVNLLGENVYQENMVLYKGRNNHVLNTAAFKQGGYLLQVKSDGELITSRFIILHE